MNTKIKVTMIMILTFVIGIFVGALLNRTLTQNRIRRILDRRSPPHFISFYENVINPSEEQRNRINEILKKYSQSLSGIHSSYREELTLAFQSMRDELDAVLTQDQKERLRKGVPFRPPRPGRNPWLHDIEGEIQMLKKELSLTQDQVLEIRLILEELRDKAINERRLRDWRRMRNQMDEMAAEKDKAIEDILNGAQKKIYKQLINERHREFEPRRRHRRQIMNDLEWR